VFLFKTAIELMPTDTHKIVIFADIAPTAEHVRRYNAPTINKVVIVLVGEMQNKQHLIFSGFREISRTFFISLLYVPTFE